jgi:riboflavin transporter FmnP
MEQTRRSNSSLANIIAYALFGAIAFVIMKLEFPLPVASFLKFDFSDAVVTIATFLFGAGPGIFIAFIKTFLSLIFSGFAVTSIVGDIAAFLATLSYALPFYFIVKEINKSNLKTRKGRLMPLVGLALGILAMTIVLALANAFLITPLYALFSVPNAPAISSYGSLLAFTEKVYLGQFLHLPSMASYIFTIIVPFNLLKGLINSIVVYLLFESVLTSIKPFVQRRFN